MKIPFIRAMVCIVICCGLVASILAANKPSVSVDDQVQKLLQSETQAINPAIDRRAALDPSSRVPSDSPALYWQSGFIHTQKQWVYFEEIGAEDAESTHLTDYLEQRNALLKHPHGRAELASWCRKHGCFDQERVHLLNALALHDSAIDPEPAFQRLGCKKIGDVWVSPQEQRDIAEGHAEIERSRKLWSSKIESVAKRLEGTPKQRAMAEKQLAEISDVVAVPAIVEILCMSSQTAAEAGVTTLGQIKEFQATRALAGQALFSPWRPVRVKSIELLKQRKMEEYVPDLLLLLSNPIRTKVQFSRLNLSAIRNEALQDVKYAPIDDPRINWDYVWVDESSDSIKVGIRRLIPFWLPAGTRQEISIAHPLTAKLLVNDAQLTEIMWQLFKQKEDLDDTADRMNDARLAMNERVGNVLSKCTDQSASSKPEDWWNWWTTYSSVTAPTQKAVVVVDERPNQQTFVVPTLRASCLVAGTPVWTERGFVAIDQIQPADRVLSKEINSGELAYKPVLRTTQRDPTEVHKFTIGDESISASLGHHFWVSGDGWTKMRKLAPAMPLHTVTGMQRISSVENEGRIEKVYNLIVADFHTYFVGNSMILSHDVLTPKLTNVKVPGLVPQ